MTHKEQMPEQNHDTKSGDICGTVSCDECPHAEDERCPVYLPEVDLSNKEIVEMPGLDWSNLDDRAKFFTALKSGKIVRGNPFAKNRYLVNLDDVMDDLIDNGGYEYLGKDEQGNARFSDTPVKPEL